jgi:hypothetical protein
MRKLLALGALLIVCASARQSAAQTADLAGVLPGDRWSYEITDEITGDLKQTTSIVVLSLSDAEINTRVTNRGALRPIQIAFDRSWNRLDDEAWRYKPSDGTGLQMPLLVGKEWRFDSQASNIQNGTTLSSAGQSRVVAQEKVTTPAGSFDTFKVETKIRQVNSNDQTKTATVTTTFWYAPSINRWVRKTQQMQIEGRVREASTEELTDYSRKP